MYPIQGHNTTSEIPVHQYHQSSSSLPSSEGGWTLDLVLPILNFDEKGSTVTTVVKNDMSHTSTTFTTTTATSRSTTTSSQSMIGQSSSLSSSSSSSSSLLHWLSRTTTTTVLRRRQQPVVVAMVGCMVGTISAIIGLHVLEEHIYYENNDDYNDIIISAVFVALIWSVSTILVAFISYRVWNHCTTATTLSTLSRRQHYHHCYCDHHPQPQESFFINHDQSPFTRKVNATDRDHCHCHCNTIDDDDDHRNGSSDELHQFIFAIGTCIGFTITCWWIHDSDDSDGNLLSQLLL